MDLHIRNVHVGRAIETRLKELKITKTELSRRIGIPQQHINRMLANDSINTARLVAVCNAMNFNFFSLFSRSVQKEISSYISMVASDGSSVQHFSGNAQILNECKFSKKECEELKETIKDKDQSIAERDEEIRQLKEQAIMMKAEIKSKEEQIELHKVNLHSKDDTIEQLKLFIHSKDDIIELLKVRINELSKERTDGK